VTTIVGLAGAGAVAAAVPGRAGGTKPGVDRGGLLHVDPNYPFRLRLANGEFVFLGAPARTRPQVTDQAPYRLTVNGVLQPGGS
jgi:hypothetical protein